MFVTIVLYLSDSTEESSTRYIYTLRGLKNPINDKNPSFYKHRLNISPAELSHRRKNPERPTRKPPS
ncbi:hypothetical protein LZ32DRAFT_609007 [Colletotrichum eremochloae]|nr:hypothetical protein LZ32DRAFT_609007 [Colletotrichum eremochloae]